MVLGDADPVESKLVSQERLVHRLAHRPAAGLAVAQDGGRRPGVVRPWSRVSHGIEEPSFHMMMSPPFRRPIPCKRLVLGKLKTKVWQSTQPEAPRPSRALCARDVHFVQSLWIFCFLRCVSSRAKE